MADKRMFSKSIIDSDAFLEMPQTSQLLYFHLSMRADDEGFVGSPKKIMRMIGANDDDMRILIGKRFVIAFESGVIVIKHWKIHNYIQSDRFKPTNYQEERATLYVKSNKAYSEVDKTLENQPRIQNGYKMDTQIRLDKNRLDKNSIDIYVQEFEEVWKEYPRKQGKSSACKAYIKARKDETSKEDILHGLQEYITYIEKYKVKGRYIKMGSTWFNQKCWEDNYDDIGRIKNAKGTKGETNKETDSLDWFFE